jgi:hypothetical protein
MACTAVGITSAIGVEGRTACTFVIGSMLMLMVSKMLRGCTCFMLAISRPYSPTELHRQE